MDIVKQGFLSDKELKVILAEKEKYKNGSHKAALYGGKTSGPHIDDNIRSSKVFFPDSIEAKKTYNILQSLIISEYIGIGFNFDFSNVASFQYAQYNVGGKFTWHHDVIKDPNYPVFRSFTFSCNISDPEEYQGGELLIMHDKKTLQLDKRQGAFIVFPSFLPHCVTTVTEGRREAMVTWIQSLPLDLEKLQRYYLQKYGNIPDVPKVD